jgi:hypothetical protein
MSLCERVCSCDPLKERLILKASAFFWGEQREGVGGGEGVRRLTPLLVAT